jgi:sRNA-binding protein
MDENRAEHVRQVLSTARATLARSRRANDEYQFREPVDAPKAPERSRGRPLASRDRTPPAPPRDAETPTWEEERATVLEVIRGLRELCEALGDQWLN